DARGCSAAANVEVPENILPLSAAIRQTSQVNCFGESNAAIEVEVKGGKGPFQFQWNDSKISSKNATGLPAGEFVVTVTDAMGTAQTARITVGQPEILEVSIFEKEPAFSDSSNDGKASAKVTGGNGNYTFQWDNGESGPKAESLSLGQHGLTVTDSKGCT
ncbi:MAG: SprB repeat-containing protein, partial [Phaeodactylibacter sp.]|nr:SprB repeat-containing protein [Phaeodactylibacter sp.]